MQTPTIVCFTELSDSSRLASWQDCNTYSELIAICATHVLDSYLSFIVQRGIKACSAAVLVCDPPWRMQLDVRDGEEAGSGVFVGMGVYILCGCARKGIVLQREPLSRWRRGAVPERRVSL